MDSLQSTSVFDIDPDALELGPIRNAAGQTGPRIKITDKHFGRCLITGYLRGWHKGTVSGRSASLLLFHFHFHFTAKKIFRYTSAGIKFTFSSSASPETSLDIEPDVSDFYPWKVYGNAIMETKSWKFDTRTSAGRCSPPAASSIPPSINNESEFTVGRRLEIHGMKQSKTTNRNQDNVCRWTIFENPATQHGIPDFFACAIVVFDNGQPFKVSVEVKAYASLEIVVDPRSWGLVTHLWKDDPLMFDGDAPLACLPPLPIQVEGSDWSKINEEQWQKLVPFPGEYEVALFLTILI